MIKLLNILSEQVSPKKDKLIKGIQSIVDQSLIRMQKETEEMGLGEMEFINEIESVEGVVVKNIQDIDMMLKTTETLEVRLDMILINLSLTLTFISQ